jgi:hypothetical protein
MLNTCAYMHTLSLFKWSAACMPHKWDEEEEKCVIRKAQVAKYVLQNRQPGESVGRGRGMAARARGAIGAVERLSQFLRNGLRVCMRETGELAITDETTKKRTS